MTGVKGEEEDLEYGENIRALFEENKKFHDEVDRLKKMRVDFGKPFFGLGWGSFIGLLGGRKKGM